ncbi:MAG: hypothetical protein PHI05_01445 [Bacilli bacterium]|nr:hypothetical protein [Bacilli bacterium]MDD4547393.1 hypothetical protein [Bacilli bacterium]
MNKKLPKVFVNKVDKVLTNNEKVSYGLSENRNFETTKKPIIQKNNMDVNQKINAIFNSPGYVYKANVAIKLNNGIINRQIIGKNNTHIITIENELIPINEILDIDFSN